MPSSLAQEIAQLHELFKLGALTEEEFNDAKQAIIRSFKAANAGASASAPASSGVWVTESPALSPPSPAEQRSDSRAPPSDSAVDAGGQPAPPSLDPSPFAATEAAAHVRNLEEWKELWDTAPIRSFAVTDAAPLDPIDTRVRALRCLLRLVRNVQLYPLEPKYGRVRESNRIIAQELMCVAEPSRAVLSFAGFVRECDEPAASPAASSAGAEAYCWVLRGNRTAAATARKAAAAALIVDELLAYFGEQQSRQYRVQQLWNSVALEVRLERASRGADSGRLPLDVPSDPEEAHSSEGESAKVASVRGAAPRPAESDAPPPPSPQALLTHLVECYTVDEAGDGLYSSMKHLHTLQRLYSEAAAASISDGAQPSSSHSLLRTADVYSAVVRQRGAVELLVYGCGARLHPPPLAVQRVLAEAAPPLLAASPTPCCDAGNDYTVQLIPCDTPDVSQFAARCLRLLRRLQREVERVQQERARAARQAAEASMQQELKRERQRRQLEQNSRREDIPVDEQTRHQRQRRRTHRRQLGAHRSAGTTSSSSSSSTDSCGDRVKRMGQRMGQRIPLSAALAILMGKRSPPSRQPSPAASSS
ncbi:hypothetical protein LSCM1_06599 [Leishmania martiniquensis]|uniref:PUB domain-containing protein n=1 Tax=Leishmania martiniquensis TaxID=1580590 RepID=A0A836KVW3_9TRYP|nr:hypothetical protein LSCM1_06599 [Leishmania martiniquensis]